MADKGADDDSIHLECASRTRSETELFDRTKQGGLGQVCHDVCHHDFDVAPSFGHGLQLAADAPGRS
jgi:hypothetical protein